MICSGSCVWFYRLNYCLCLPLPSRCYCGYPPNILVGAPEQDNVLTFRKLKCHLYCQRSKVADEYKHPSLYFPLSKRLSEVAYIVSKPIKIWITRGWTLTSARYMQFCAFHVHLKLQSPWKVNRMTFGLLEECLVKQIWGDFWPLTDHRSASINIIERPIEGGHPTNIPQICFY